MRNLGLRVLTENMKCANLQSFINSSVFLIGLFLLLSQETAPTCDSLVKFEVVELWGSIELCTTICFCSTGGLECFDWFAMYYLEEHNTEGSLRGPLAPLC